MMNQSEIDAGPPNKKPKIGNNPVNVGGSGTLIISNSTNTTTNNGISTQISDSSG